MFQDHYSIKQEITLDAYLTYVGKRTLEVRIDLTDQMRNLQLTVKYLFVAKHNPNILISYEDNQLHYWVLDEAH